MLEFAREAYLAEFSKTHRVQWGETDAAGIVFYPNYFRWFDQATHDLFRALGYSVREMWERGFAIPLVESGSRFFGSLSYDDELRITSRVAEVRTRAFRVEHQLYRHDELVCEGFEVRMWVRIKADGSETEPQVIPAELRRLLATT